MKTFRATFALIGLFFAGLLVLWWLDYTGVPTERERMQRLNRVLPALMDTPEAAIHRLEISHGGENLVFERRGPGRWQMRKPLDVAAEPGPLENLVRNLKDLRRSADSGAISGPAEPYGLAPPEATIRLWGDRTTGPAAQERPLAALEIGKATTGYRYVRAAGSGAIDVIDKKLVAGIDRTVPQWREYSLMPVATFQVASLAVHRDGLNIQAQRGRGGQWRLTAPIVVPANGAKIESALAALSSVRVVEGAKGFVADNVTDFAPYGLDKPEATIELTTPAQPDGPLVLQVGKRAPGQSRPRVRPPRRPGRCGPRRRPVPFRDSQGQRGLPRSARCRDRARRRQRDPDPGASPEHDLYPQPQRQRVGAHISPNRESRYLPGAIAAQPVEQPQDQRIP